MTEAPQDKNQSVDSAIWVVAEQADKGLHEASLEVLGEGRRLADQLRSELAAVLMGANGAGLADDLIHGGADRVYLAGHELLLHYTTEAYAKVLTTLIRQYRPRVVLLAATPNGSDLAPCVATRLRTGLVTNCTILKLNKEGVLEMTQPICDDRVYRIVVCPSAQPLIVTIRPGALGKDKPDVNRAGQVVEVRPELNPEDLRKTVIGFVKADPKTLSLEEAEVVVVGGNGVESEANWQHIGELAASLGGCVGGSRMAMDNGWIPRERLVGQTGKTISPNFCIEAGVSGAIQHTAGLKDAKFIVAINKDRNAPIFKTADLGIVADLNDLLPELIGRLRQAASPDSDANDGPAA